MMTEPLPVGVGPAQLTEALRRASALADQANVREITVENARPTILSRIFRLRLTYDRITPDAPSFVNLKTGLPERIGSGWNAGRQEVAFYTEVAATMSLPLVPRCFEAHWDAQTETWRLLLEDLTESHYIARVWPLPPTMEQCAKIVRRRPGSTPLGSSDPLTLQKDLNSARCQPHLDFAAGKAVGDAVEWPSSST